MRIRMAEEKDTASLLEIYAYYVENTAVTFEYAVPSLREFRERLAGVRKRYPCLAAEEEGEITGYAYVSPFKNRAAYDWAVETTVYVKKGRQGGGAGRKLYTALEEILKLQNISNLYACIAWPNPESIGFHERMGYQTIGHFTKCGYKQGKWYDMVWMEKMLSGHPEEPRPVISADRLDKRLLEDLLSCYSSAPDF